MADNYNTTDPYYQDWQLFDPSETEFESEKLLKCPTFTTEDFSSYLASFPSTDFNTGGPLRDFDSSPSQTDYDNAQAFFADGPTLTLHPSSMIGISMERGLPLPLTPNNHPQVFFPSSAPELGTSFGGEDPGLNFGQTAEIELPSVLPEPFVGTWSPCAASQPEPSTASHKSSHGPGFIEFIQYTVDSKTQRVKKLDSNAESRKGRKGKLTAGQRRDADRMRKLGACASCRKRREKVSTHSVAQASSFLINKR